MKVGFKFPAEPRQTALHNVEEWYQKLICEKLGREYEPIKRSNFGQYSMAVNYITSVMEEAVAIEKVAIFNIDHMAQIQFKGADAEALLDRVLPANIPSMKIGQCKYTLLLTEQGTVLDDLIIMKQADDDFILVINAGHDITDTAEDHGEMKEFTADADFILSYKKDNEDVDVKDISAELVKIDVQGPLSYKLLKELYGQEVLRNRNKPAKNMGFFSFNNFTYEGNDYILSRTGYTNRWGWELYVPVAVAEDQFKRIAEKALELGGLVVGLGGRDENRISAGQYGLPLNGSEYDPQHTPTNSPLFNAAVDMTKENFVGKKALEEDDTTQKMVVVISEGIVVGRAVYKDGQRLGKVTSSINSPNVSLEKRLLIGSKRKYVNQENGYAAIGLAWLNNTPFEVDADGKEIMEKDGKPVYIPVEFFTELEDGSIKGKALKGFISSDGINPATAPRPLKNIEKL